MHKLGIHGLNTGDTWAEHRGYMGKTPGIHGQMTGYQCIANIGTTPAKAW